MSDSIEKILDESFDWILNQLTKGNTIEGLKSNRLFLEFEKVKEWKSRYGYQFHIYSNDHPIDNKPHFHLIKKSEDIECRVFFDGRIHDYKGKGILDKKAKDSLEYFLENSEHQDKLKELWNKCNPKYAV